MGWGQRTLVVKDRNRISSELVMYFGSDSSHAVGTFASLSAYTSRSNEPAAGQHGGEQQVSSEVGVSGSNRTLALTQSTRGKSKSAGARRGSGKAKHCTYLLLCGCSGNGSHVASWVQRQRMGEAGSAHGSSSSGKKVTEAVICRMIAEISLQPVAARISAGRGATCCREAALRRERHWRKSWPRLLAFCRGWCRGRGQLRAVSGTNML